MKKIIPHLWFDTQAQAAAEFYVSLFPNSKITNSVVLEDTPSGDAKMVTFTLAGQNFMAISAGPFFTINPSISMFTVFDSEEEIDAAWAALSAGGTVLMEYQEYPWAKKYGWVQDRFGLSWQLSLSENHQLAQKITPLLMFTNAVVGKAQEAIEQYTSLFPDSFIDTVVHYEERDGASTDYIKHARFTLGGMGFMAMDSGKSDGPHTFTFNEGISLVVSCDTQEEIDTYWNALSAVPESEQCGWLKDVYGVSWQIVPTVLEKLMTSGDKEQTARVTQAFLNMKKFDIAALEAAAQAA